MAFLTNSLLALLAMMLQTHQFTLGAAVPYVERQATVLPSYVVDYAPVVWLQSTEPYQPSDLGAQLVHTVPRNNFTAIPGVPEPLTLDNLDSLNALGGNTVYLTSIDDVTTNPAWLYGVKPDKTGRTEGATSCAIIVNDHGAGNVDAFYMYFYAYNQGPTILDQEIGDHVGDWEHNMIRFLDGVPQVIWFSQHGNGEAFTYECVEKQGRRPVVYSAQGSHANYATTGTHDHTIPDLNLPVGPVEDHCDQGTLWDPALSAYYYSYEASSNKYTAYKSSDPTSWLYFVGKWGDDEYPLSDPRQKEFLDIPLTAKYVGGPTGPEDKQLNRTKVCPDNGILCIIRSTLGP